MAKLNLQKLVSDFEDCLGWPYVSPGSNNQDGIDCSGMFVRAYKLQGASIAHGSNTIYRKYLTNDKGPITSASQLKVGMAVFKRKDWQKDKESDRNNQYYGDSIGNMSHIGLVVSINPVMIVHASTNGMKVRKDKWSSAWNYYGYLKDVDYSSGGEVKPVVHETRYVYSENGGAVNLRGAASTSTGQILARVPSGEQVTLFDDNGIWSYIQWNSIEGYMQSKFLTQTTPGPSTKIKEQLRQLCAEMAKLIEQL